MSWHPLRTAPIDGTRIDLWTSGELPRRVPDVSWNPDLQAWWTPDGQVITNGVQWMPRPAGP